MTPLKTSRKVRTWKRALAACLVIAVVLAAYLAFEALNRSTVTILVQEKYAFQPCGGPGSSKLQVQRDAYSTCAVVATDQGTFRLPKVRRSRYGFSYVDGLWTDPPQEIWQELKVGCHYTVVMTGGGNLFARQPLGTNLVPPLNKIVRVLSRDEPHEPECETGSVGASAS